jgi:hypothetical protein
MPLAQLLKVDARCADNVLHGSEDASPSLSARATTGQVRVCTTWLITWFQLLSVFMILLAANTVLNSFTLIAVD